MRDPVQIFAAIILAIIVFAALNIAPLVFNPQVAVTPLT